MNRRARITSGVVLMLAGGALPLTGCTSTPLGGTQACIDWVYFEAPADAYDDADAVARGRIVGREGTTSYLDLPATTWKAEIDEWVKGTGKTEIVVTSLPRSCGESGDSLADAMDAGDEVILFLRERSSGWEAITPWQGTIAATPDGGIPDAWPEDLYG
ncbi:hypothetical protein [Microbacterium sp. PMB16]|uniref:hypothetical protein n=1 Tax=Microbacterium sp. PMB16 TaxID=3120157 RepID=UPI003F4C85DB